MSVAMARQYCVSCRQETLHERWGCIHCRVAPLARSQPAERKPRPYRVEFGGEVLSLTQLARREGVALSTLTERFRNGATGAELVRKVPPLLARPKAKRTG